MDFDFEVNESLDKQILKNGYHNQVLSLFRPFVQSKLEQKALKSRDYSDYKNDPSSNSKALVVRSNKNDNSSSSTIRLREKAVALQK